MAVISIILFSSNTVSQDDSFYWVISSFIYNISVCLALYALLLFYIGTREHPHLVGKKPITKFIAIKLVIVVTWYQGFLLMLLPGFHLLLTTKWNNFLLCLEMPLFACLNVFAYPVDEFAGGTRITYGFDGASGDVELAEDKLGKSSAEDEKEEGWGIESVKERKNNTGGAGGRGDVDMRRSFEGVKVSVTPGGGGAGLLVVGQVIGKGAETWSDENNVDRYSQQPCSRLTRDLEEPDYYNSSMIINKRGGQGGDDVPTFSSKKVGGGVKKIWAPIRSDTAIEGEDVDENWDDVKWSSEEDEHIDGDGNDMPCIIRTKDLGVIRPPEWSGNGRNSEEPQVEKNSNNSDPPPVISPISCPNSSCSFTESSSSLNTPALNVGTVNNRLGSPRLDPSTTPASSSRMGTLMGAPLSLLQGMRVRGTREATLRNVCDAVLMTDVVKDAYYSFNAKYQSHALLIDDDDRDDEEEEIEGKEETEGKGEGALEREPYEKEEEKNSNKIILVEGTLADDQRIEAGSSSSQSVATVVDRETEPCQNICKAEEGPSGTVAKNL